MRQPRLQFLLCLLVYALAVRLMPYLVTNPDIKGNPFALYYPWNFSPLTAVCLFGGAFLPKRSLALLIPLGILFLSDLGILAITGNWEWAFPPGRWPMTYVCFCLAASLGFALRKSTPGQARIGAVGLGLAYEVAFFAVSNFLVWYVASMSAEPDYPYTAEGLQRCYTVALPFFGKALLSTAAFTLLLFSPIGIHAATEPAREIGNGELAPVRVK